MDYITSDPHINHKNIFGKDGFCEKRVCFETAEEMNETIIKNINSVVEDKDTLYILGDIGFGKPKEIFEVLDKIHCRIVIVRGNHDRSDLVKYILRNNYQFGPKGLMKYEIHDLGIRLKANKKVYYLSHFPIDLGEQRANLRSICGHIHENSAPAPNQLNIGMDSPEIPDLPFGTPIPLLDAFKLVDKKWEESKQEIVKH